MTTLLAVLVVTNLVLVGVIVFYVVSPGRRGSSVDAGQTQQHQLNAFSAAAQQALAGQSQQLLQLAETRYGALSDHTSTVLGHHSEAVGAALHELGERLGALERERAQSTMSLSTMVRELTLANQAARDETAQLRSSLRDSRVRGSWGEVQLRRVLELSGLERHSDFAEQHSVSTASDQRDTFGRLRPDVVVHLPSERCVVIDAKAPLDRFLDAANCDDPDRQQQLLREHAKAVDRHVNALASRGYSSAIDGAVDMVVLFIPGESFLSAALDADPTLFESAAQRGVVLCSPSSLLPLLRGIAVGWRERYASEHAAEIQRLGAELHERVALFLEQYATVGQRIGQLIDAYNRSVGSAQSRLVVTARKLETAGAGSPRTIPEPTQVLGVPRAVSTEERPSPAVAAELRKEPSQISPP